MTLLDHAAGAGPAVSGPLAVAAVVRALYPLVRAEALAEAPAAMTEPADLEQAVWLRLLEHMARQGPLDHPARWVRDAVRAEARGARRRVRREQAYATGELPGDPSGWPERVAVSASESRALRSAVDRLPGRCPRLLGAMLAAKDSTYREIAGELGMSQGSLGPIRSRCLGCLRRMLAAEVVAPELRGMER